MNNKLLPKRKKEIIPRVDGADFGKGTDVGWHDRFVARMKQSPNVTEACLAAGVDRATAYEHRKRFPDFAQAWRDAEEAALDAMEESGYERATKGVRRVKFSSDGSMEEEWVPSDTLTKFFLTARRKEIYGQAQEITVNNKILVVTSEDLLKLAEQRASGMLETIAASLSAEVLEAESRPE